MDGRREAQVEEHRYKEMVLLLLLGQEEEEERIDKVPVVERLEELLVKEEVGTEVVAGKEQVAAEEEAGTVVVGIGVAEVVVVAAEAGTGPVVALDCMPEQELKRNRWVAAAAAVGRIEWEATAE